MCASGSVDHLERGKDTFLSCHHCGGGANSTRFVPTVRNKNCAEKDDQSRHASDPTMDARTAELEAYANGPENADARRRRHLATAGGTRLSTKAVKKNDLSKAQNKVDTCTARAMRESLDINARDATRKRAILRMVEAVFDQLPNLHEGIQKYIRLEAIRIYTLSMAHDRVCGQKSCWKSISARANATVSYCMVENILERLCAADELAKQTLAEKCQGEVTQLQLRGFLAKLKALQLRYASVQQRLQVASAIDIIAHWQGSEVQTRCPPPESPQQQPPPPPSPLQLPASMVDASVALGARTLPTESGAFEVELRDRVCAAARCTDSRAEIRTAALDALVSTAVVDFLRAAKCKGVPLPTDLLAIGLLVATARKLGQETIEAHKVVKSILRDHAIAASTLDKFVVSMVEILATVRAKQEEEPIW